MSVGAKVGEKSSTASEIHASQKASLKELLPNPKQIWGKSVEVVKDFLSIRHVIAATLRNYIEMLSYLTRSDVESTYEDFRWLKTALRRKDPNKLNKETLRSDESIDRWMKGSDCYSPAFKAHIKQRLGGEQSLRELVKHNPFTRAVIRDRNISSEEALVIHALLNGKAGKVQGAVMIEVLGNGLRKLPDHIGDCYYTNPSDKYAFDLGGTYPYVNHKAATESKIHPATASKQDVYIIKSNRGKSVREFTDASHKRNVIFLPDTEFTISKIKHNNYGTRTVTLVDPEEL